MTAAERRKLANNPNTSIETLLELNQDRLLMVLSQLAMNPNIKMARSINIT